MLLLLDMFVGLVCGLLVLGTVLHIVPGLIYFERKICAYIQCRLGPNRVNFVLPLPGGGRLKLIPGSLQPLADGIKLAFKEEIIPRDADKLLWFLGPIVAFFPVVTALAFIPFGIDHWDVWGTGYVVDLRTAAAPGAGVLALLSVGALSVYGIAAGGWGSGSKYPLMSAVRGTAQMISYELAMGLALVAAMVTAGSADLQEIIHRQADTPITSFTDCLMGFLDWNLVKQPLAALIFVVAAFAENNRLPFDLPECEPELIGGYHTEYSGLKFGVFFLGEYAAMILMCALFSTLFLGGWSLPGVVDPAGAGLPWLQSLCGAWAGGFNALLSVGVFMAKLSALLFVQLWIRWTLPRFRYDQLMNLGWKVMIPLALVNLVATAIFFTIYE